MLSSKYLQKKRDRVFFLCIPPSALNKLLNVLDRPDHPFLPEEVYKQFLIPYFFQEVNEMSQGDLSYLQLSEEDL